MKADERGSTASPAACATGATPKSYRGKGLARSILALVAAHYVTARASPLGNDAHTDFSHATARTVSRVAASNRYWRQHCNHRYRMAWDRRINAVSESHLGRVDGAASGLTRAARGSAHIRRRMNAGNAAKNDRSQRV
jgi:hypothetical protein